MLTLHARTLDTRPRQGLDNGLSSGYCTGVFTRLTSVAIKRQRLQIRILKVMSMGALTDVAGFGSQRTGDKAKHKVLSLDPSKVEQVHTFNVFARRFAENEPASKWERIGEILVEKETDLEMALKERRKKLLAAALHQYPSFMILSAGEEVQYGYRKSGEESQETEIMVVDVKGKELDASIPAILRADDGVKPSPPIRFQRK